MIFQLFLILIFVNTNLFYCDQIFEKVKFSDISAITFYQGKYTVGRKTFLQMSCISDQSLCDKYSLDVIQCQKTGDVNNQWSCKANLPKNVNIGEKKIECEGFDYPDDSYVIKGSCRLQYFLEENTFNSNFFGPFIIGLLVIMIIFVYYATYKTENSFSDASQSSNNILRNNPSLNVSQSFNNILNDNPPSFQECMGYSHHINIYEKN